jgi:hypothetical protein
LGYLFEVAGNGSGGLGCGAFLEGSLGWDCRVGVDGVDGVDSKNDEASEYEYEYERYVG